MHSQTGALVIRVIPVFVRSANVWGAILRWLHAVSLHLARLAVVWAHSQIGRSFREASCAQFTKEALSSRQRAALPIPCSRVADVEFTTRKMASSIKAQRSLQRDLPDAFSLDTAARERLHSSSCCSDISNCSPSGTLVIARSRNSCCCSSYCRCNSCCLLSALRFCVQGRQT